MDFKWVRCTGVDARALNLQLSDPIGLVEIFTKRDNIRLLEEGGVSDRKYRQHGYQDSGEKRERQSAEKPVKKETFGPRALQMPGTHTVSRCAQCGALLTSISEPIGQCPKCKFELHSCRQCTYFDTSSRFECSQPVPERVARKDERNECTFYSMRVRVEKETSTPASARPMDARAAFENLFKK
jgi:uncharacterized protein with PIN domain